METGRVRQRLGEALSAAKTPQMAADRLCEVCVEVLDVDAAAISFIRRGVVQGTFGSSGELGRSVDQLQFTFGIGPCLDAVVLNRPVFAEDLDDPAEDRWPGLIESVLGEGVRSVYALPVTVAGRPIGALDLLRARSGPFEAETRTGGAWAASLASLPLLDLMNADIDWQAAADGADGFDQLASLERVEVYQATGRIIGAFDVDAADAVALLRAHAVAQGLTASEAAYRVLDERIVLADGQLRPAGGREQR